MSNTGAKKITVLSSIFYFFSIFIFVYILSIFSSKLIQLASLRKNTVFPPKYSSISGTCTCLSKKIKQLKFYYKIKLKSVTDSVCCINLLFEVINIKILSPIFSLAAPIVKYLRVLFHARLPRFKLAIKIGFLTSLLKLGLNNFKDKKKVFLTNSNLIITLFSL